MQIPVAGVPTGSPQTRGRQQLQSAKIFNGNASTDGNASAALKAWVDGSAAAALQSTEPKQPEARCDSPMRSVAIAAPTVATVAAIATDGMFLTSSTSASA